MPQVSNGAALVIDPEFAFVGPLAFDPAKVIGELLITYFATDGLEAAPGASSRVAQRAWLLETVVEVWQTFSNGFLRLWSEAAAVAGPGEVCRADLLGAGVPGGPAALATMQADYMARVFREAVAFAGARTASGCCDPPQGVCTPPSSAWLHALGQRYPV